MSKVSEKCMESPSSDLTSVCVNKRGKESRISRGSSLGAGSPASPFLPGGERCHRGTEPKSENEFPWTDVCLRVRTRDSQTCSQPVLGWLNVGWPPPRSSGEGSANPQGNDVPMEISGTAERLLYVGSLHSACGRAAWPAGELIP